MKNIIGKARGSLNGTGQDIEITVSGKLVGMTLLTERIYLTKAQASVLVAALNAGAKAAK